MSVKKSIAKRLSLSDLIRMRDDARLLASEGYRALALADERMKGLRYYAGLSARARPQKTVHETLREIDRQFWRRGLELTGLDRLMDATEKAKLEEQIRSRKCPAFERDEIARIFGDMYADSDEMFRRGLVRIFQKLSGNYRSHSAFKIGPRFIMRLMLQFNLHGGAAIGYRATDELDDLARVLYILDGRPHRPRELESDINQAFSEKPWEFENDLIRVKGFRNQNLHVYIKRQGLIDKVNRIIAEHYGAVLGQDAA